ncbi:MAG: glyoxalase [Bacteroidota bacterium]
MTANRLSIRPKIVVEKEASTAMETFQNDVLRPIVKMQNDLLIDIYKHFLRKRKVPFDGMSIKKREQWIAQSLTKDNRLRGIMLGAIIGHFTAEEWSYFQAEESEARRRITSLITQRLQSQQKQLL